MLDIIDKKINDEIIAFQRSGLEKELKNLKSTSISKGVAAAVFKLKDKVVGKKKGEGEIVSMKHPVTHQNILSKDDITKTALD